MVYAQKQLVRILSKESRLFQIRLMELLEEKGIISKDEVSEIFNTCPLDRDWLALELCESEPDTPFGLLAGLDGPGSIEERVAKRDIEEPQPENDIQMGLWAAGGE